jgi:hypothetical protein
MQTSISAWRARCRLKPTGLRHFLADLAHLLGPRCRHPLQQFSDVDTNLVPVTYAARHQRTVRQNVDGAWASSVLADYPLELTDTAHPGSRKHDTRRFLAPARTGSV